MLYGAPYSFRYRAMANPPFNLKGWRTEDELTDDPRFLKAGFTAMPPVANANYAWICHMLSKLDVTHGIAGFLLANGALGAGDVEYTLRKEILEKDRVEAIIVLPRDMFYTTDISVTLWIINMNKKAGTVNGRQLRDRTHEVLFMDLRSWDQNEEEIVIDKGKKKRKTIFTDEQISEVKRIYNAWQTGIGYKDVPELCRAETLDGPSGIRTMNYSLAPSKYIEFINKDSSLDASALMKELSVEIRHALDEERETVRLLELATKEV